jgi:hypothetical protein
MPTATTYNNNALNREDILDTLTRIEPEDTPLYSSLKKGVKPGAVYLQWPVDTLQDVSTSVIGEGTDIASFEDHTDERALLGNYPSIQVKSWKVSDLQTMVDVAGVGNEVAEAKMKKLKELKRNIAARVGGDFDAVATGPNYEARGLGEWIKATAQTVDPVPAAYRTPSASINTTAMASLAETDINDVLTSVYKQGGNRANGNVYCGPSFKRAVSNFSRITGTNHRTYQVTEDAKSKKITLNVTMYEGDFGTIALIPDLFLGYGASTTETIRGARAYYIDPELISVPMFEAPYHTELEDAGGGPRGFFKAIYTVCVKSPLGLGKWAATA